MRRATSERPLSPRPDRPFLPDVVQTQLTPFLHLVEHVDAEPAEHASVLKRRPPASPSLLRGGMLGPAPVTHQSEAVWAPPHADLVRKVTVGPEQLPTHPRPASPTAARSTDAACFVQRPWHIPIRSGRLRSAQVSSTLSCRLLMARRARAAVDGHEGFGVLRRRTYAARSRQCLPGGDGAVYDRNAIAARGLRRHQRVVG